jgi:hypothetical protein
MDCAHQMFLEKFGMWLCRGTGGELAEFSWRATHPEKRMLGYSTAFLD